MMNEIQTAQKEFGILDRVPEGVCVLGADFSVLFWNRCLEVWTKIARSDILGKDIGIYFPHLLQPKYAHRLQQIFEGGPPTIFSSQLHKSIIPCQMPDGKWRIQHTTVTAVPAPDWLWEGKKQPHQTKFYALLVIEDVTDVTYRIQDYREMRDRALEEINERKKVEEALRESQNFIEKIADATPCLIYIYDLIQKKNIYVNGQVTVLLGYRNTEIKTLESQLFSNLIHPDDLGDISLQMAKLTAMQDGDILEREYRIKHRSGEWRWFHSREIVFSRTPEGWPKQILGTAQDITNRKWTEESMRLQTEKERLMNLITQHIHRSLDLNEVLNTTAIEVRNFLQTDRAIIFRFQSHTPRNCNLLSQGIVAVESVSSECSSILGSTIPECLPDTNTCLLYKGENILSIEDICNADIPYCHRELLKKWGVKADLEVPILQGSQFWGLLMLHQCKEIREWQPLEIDLMKQLANQLAIAIQQAELYQQLQAANEQLQRLATSDGLTHLANRRKFDEYLSQQLRILAREQQPISLILCDIDYFKSYNDTYGHQSGDECLRVVAKAIQRAVKRPADLVARYGGEEFAAILPYTDLKGALRVAKEMLLRVRDLQIPHAASATSDRITVSAGVASLVPNPNLSPAELIAVTDLALYRAKKLGRDRVITYTGEQ